MEETTEAIMEKRRMMGKRNMMIIMTMDTMIIGEIMKMTIQKKKRERKSGASRKLSKNIQEEKLIKEKRQLV